MKKEKDKGPTSPYDNLNAKKEQDNGPNCASVLQQNGIVVMQNGGLDDDKAFKYVALHVAYIPYPYLYLVHIRTRRRAYSY